MPEKGELPEDIPAYPQGTYKDRGWKGWGDWLGTGTVAPRDRKYRSFKEARAFVRSLGLNSGNEWGKYYKGEIPEKGILPKDIPVHPERTYKDKGWRGMGDWLGTGTIATQDRKYRSFKEARAFVHTLGLKSETEWRKYRKGELLGKKILPKDIPSVPNHVYKDSGWNGWRDWLGTGR